MTQYQRTLDSESVQRLVTGDGQLSRLLEAVLNQVVNAQVSEPHQAAPYERSEQRPGYRHGYKPRQFTTRVGALTLLVPQVRDGQFSPELFAHSQRSDQALVLTLMEMVVTGVSTRNAARITEEVCGTRFATSTVSELCKALDPLVSACNDRDLSAQRYPNAILTLSFCAGGCAGGQSARERTSPRGERAGGDRYQRARLPRSPGAAGGQQRRASGRVSGNHVVSLRLLSSDGASSHSVRMASPVIDADARLLRDALDNLLENAVNYTPEGGSIDVTLAVRAAGALSGLPVASGSPGGTKGLGRVAGPEPPGILEIVVRDTGVGIPAEHLGRVFERFHRVDMRLTREVDGPGLGLAMCKRIAELHGGTIWAESAPGEGSAFHLLLPLVASYTTPQTLAPVV